jgi:hypothetical protein
MNTTTAHRTGGMLLVAALLTPLMSGCDLLGQEGQCSAGEFPVYATSNPNGGDCVKNGHKIPPGFAAYPEGRVPKYVGDKYDRWPLAKDYPWKDEVDPRLRK